MGLDGVELLMEIEDRFAIEVPDDAATQMRTVGDTYWFIVGCMNQRLDQFKPASREQLLDRVQRAIADAWAADRSTIEPQTQLASLCPFKHRRQAWERLERCLHCPLPRLKFPEWLGCLWLIGIVVAAGFTISVIAMPRMLVPALIAWVVIGIGVAANVWRKKSGAGYQINSRVDTVEKLITWLTSQWLTSQSTASGIWLELQSMVAEQAGKKPEEIQMHTRYVEDLKF